jgi:hypothetical protein
MLLLLHVECAVLVPPTFLLNPTHMTILAPYFVVSTLPPCKCLSDSNSTAGWLVTEPQHPSSRKYHDWTYVINHPHRRDSASSVWPPEALRPACIHKHMPCNSSHTSASQHKVQQIALRRVLFSARTDTISAPSPQFQGRYFPPPNAV